MEVEYGKKENRSEAGHTLTMAEFLDVYKKNNIYMVSDLSPGLYNEWAVPRFLQCGGYADHIEIVLLWFSSGGTKSVLHTNTQENLHCLVSCSKKFVIIKPYFAESIGPEHKNQGFYDIDVERLNPKAEIWVLMFGGICLTSILRTVLLMLMSYQSLLLLVTLSLK